ncbi:predicted protein [Streptomyces viridosporus ATCC 14672]|uniref:Predicted protein n=1 Tax=Streptomyces viridosporus (strain ATCC 14672 / DSM 40746 / JCM 4963 / KCTC 9882 / NRRL B-12104 / FH 1290) TaxID=566461 RepID=D6A4E4_STRV1|nr:hypothetical protein [Streptomyces viridosporus]EFE65784.1 predicted protein [Streptomyces viridosporus ATCC 14672]
MTARPMSARRARAIIDAAVLVKAPDWRESHRWHVVTDSGEVLVVVAPSYGGTSATGRNGWTWWLAALGPSGGSRREDTREKAAARGLADWTRWATADRR